MSDLLSKLQEIFEDVFDTEDLTLSPEMKTSDIKEWSSLMHVNLLIAIEKEYDIKFTAKEASQVGSVGQLMEIIESKLQAAGS